MVQEKLWGKTEFGIAVGKQHSGKTTLCKEMQKSMGFKLIDIEAISAALKTKLAPEGEEEEFVVPVEKIEEEIGNQMKSGGGKRTKYVIDGLNSIHKTPEAQIAFLRQYGMPEFILNLTTSQKTVEARYCEKNEKEPGEETTADVTAIEEADAALRPKILEEFEKFAARCKIVTLSTDTSLETTCKSLK